MVKADVWSLGITLIELAQGDPPLFELHPMKALLQIPFRKPPTLEHPERYSDRFSDFLAHCLNLDPDGRDTVSELLKHPFVQTNLASPNEIKTIVHKFTQFYICFMIVGIWTSLLLRKKLRNKQLPKILTRRKKKKCRYFTKYKKEEKLFNLKLSCRVNILMLFRHLMLLYLHKQCQNQVHLRLVILFLAQS